MKAKVKAKWIAALRSGKFTQGSGALKQVENGKTTHCCLGVLRAIQPGIHRESDSHSEILKETCGIPTSVQQTLARYNDSEEKGTHKTFKGIARWIEKNIEVTG